VAESRHGGAGGVASRHPYVAGTPERHPRRLRVYYTQDNSAKARQVVTDLMELYRPEEHVQHDVPRDKRLMYESLNGDYGFFLRSSKLIESSKTRFQDLEIHETPQFGSSSAWTGAS